MDLIIYHRAKGGTEIFSFAAEESGKEKIESLREKVHVLPVRHVVFNQLGSPD